MAMQPMKAEEFHRILVAKGLRPANSKPEDYLPNREPPAPPPVVRAPVPSPDSDLPPE